MPFQKGNKINSGKKHSDIAKRKMSDTAKKNMTEERRKQIGETGRGKHFFKHTEATKKNMSERQKGSKGCNWQGGITPKVKAIRNSLKYADWRKQIFLRDDFTCQDCGQRGGDLEVHHTPKTFSQWIEEIKQNLPLMDLFEAAMIYTPLWDLDNGITYCKNCHKKIKKGRC